MSLPNPGTPSFLPLVIAYLQNTPELHGWNFDPTLLSVLLIALIVNRGGLIIDIERERQECKDRVDRVGKVVTALLESVFERSTRHVKLSSSSEPDDVARLLLAPPQHNAQSLLRSKARYCSSTSSPTPNLDVPTPEDNLKLPDALIISGIESASSPAQLKLLTTLHSGKLSFDGREYVAAEGWLAVWVREGGEVPSWLVDQFSCSIRVYPEDLDLPPSELVPASLIPRDYLANLSLLLPYVHIHPPLQIHISNLLSAVSLHPRLHATITARAVLTFPELVRTHWLLASPFSLPPDWEDALRRDRALDDGLAVKLAGASARDSKEKFGLGGGRGGVDTWGPRAGEAPDVRSLFRRSNGSGNSGDLQGESGSGEGNDPGEGGGGGAEDWYANLRDVEGAWGLGVRHRVRWREEGEEVMWLLTRSAAGGTGQQGGQGGKEGEGRKRKRAREVEGILERILRTV